MVCGVKGMFEKQSSTAAAKVLTLICTLWAFAVPAMPQQRSDLRRTHTAFHNALRDADASMLERRLDEHFTWTHTDGLVQSKADLLEKIRVGKLRYAELSTDQETFNEYTKAAEVTGHSRRRYADATKPFELRYTLTFVKVGREWKVAAYHTTIFTPGVGQPLQVRLGYPRDAKLLILNADDLAVSHSEDVASFAALEQKLITSATVMVPCSWFTEVAAYAKLDEVEAEIRAQIERAKSMGLEPSHLDAHMHTLYRTPELFGVFLKVAREYKLPIRMARNDQPFQSMLPLMAPGDPIPDAIFSPGEDVPASGWTDYYVNLIKNLQPGVTEIFVHLAHDDAETQAVTVNHPEWGAAWREREVEAMSSPAFRKALEENHSILIGWPDIKKLL